jgi:membrane protein YqaA with SNARE-associated domain
LTDKEPRAVREELKAEEEVEVLLDHRGEVAALEAAAPTPFRHRLRTLVVGLETAFVVVLIVLWLTVKAFHHSNSLWVLFFYCFPSQFLLAALPHEPVVLFFGKFYPPLVVALVATAGTVLVEAINYSVFKYLADFKAMAKVVHSKLVMKFVTLFKKAPFASLWIAGLLPIPFYPFRFLVVLGRYPLPAYLLAVLTSRLPRFFILAFLGNRLVIPNGVLIGLFALLVAVAVVPLVREFLRREKKEPDPASGDRSKAP